jgi:S1-C subfamily serine protease
MSKLGVGVASAAIAVLTGCLPAAPGVHVEPDAVQIPEIAADGIERRAWAAAVRIRAELCGSVSSGSGFSIGSGLIVTNSHVVAGAVKVVVADRLGVPHLADVVVDDPGSDLAVLKLANPPGTVVDLELNTEGARPGAKVVIAGHPNSGVYVGEHAMVLGTIDVSSDPSLQAAFAEAGVGLAQIIATDAGSTAPGSSGGPAVDEQGRVVGIVFGYDTRQVRTYLIDPGELPALVAEASGGGRTPPTPAPCT